MALVHLHVYSRTLGMQVSIDVILPEATQGIGVAGNQGWDGQRKLPVLYLLHGMSDDHTIWQRRTSVERYAADKTVAIVMPTTHLASYTNQAYGLRYYDYIAHELPEICKSYFPISEKREETFIAGLSMGGYGALKIGLRERQRFGAVAAYSSGLLRSERLPAEAQDYPHIHALEQAKESLDPGVFRQLLSFYTTFGSPSSYDASEENHPTLFTQAAAASGEPLPKLWLACGTEDFLYEANEQYHQLLTDLEIPHEYHTEAGGHEWRLWDKWIGETLEWLPL